MQDIIVLSEYYGVSIQSTITQALSKQFHIIIFTLKNLSLSVCARTDFCLKSLQRMQGKLCFSKGDLNSAEFHPSLFFKIVNKQEIHIHTCTLCMR